MWRFLVTKREAKVRVHLALFILVLDILQLCTTGLEWSATLLKGLFDTAVQNPAMNKLMHSHSYRENRRGGGRGEREREREREREQFISTSKRSARNMKVRTICSFLTDHG